jgi:hypothetical protein
MVTKEQIIGAFAAAVVYILIGALGSLLEKAGIKYKSPRLEALGKLLESVGADGPKGATNLGTLVAGAKSTGDAK